MQSSQLYQSLPQKPGVYLFLDKNGNVLYVGKAKNLRNRVSSYFVRSADLGEKTRLLVSQIAQVNHIVVESELESLLLEANYIKKYTPKYNIRMTDGKSYPSIQITVDEVYPAVLFARKQDDEKSLYWGPFPSSKTVKNVLRIIRRVFPFQSAINHPKRMCLYHHLGLCPCPPLFTTDLERVAYKKTVQKLVDFLSGKKTHVIKELEKERGSAAKKEDFELAQRIQKQIDAIVYITSPMHRPFEYEINPNLREDLRRKELEILRGILEKSYGQLPFLHRIECYDNSNIQGHNAVSSMVVLTDGEKDSSQYRKFKVRSLPKGKADDFATMQEVLQRRMKHSEWPMPNLIIVDGGKGQVSAAKVILDELGLHIPLIGLAKREETIVTKDLKEIPLPKDSEALHVIQRIRDEAHRFAITYHRKLRSKAVF